MKSRFTKSGSLKALKELGLPVGTVIDIGVHRQTPELIEAFPDKPHLLFEPVIEYHEDIRKNYSQIDYTLFPIALSSETSEGYLGTIDLSGTGDISHSYIASDRDPGARKISISSLDDALNKINCTLPYLIKLDVDGVELDVLRGSINSLTETVCVIIECPISMDYKVFFERSNYLMANGFALWDIVDFCYYKNQLSQVDLVFVRQDFKMTNLSPWNQPFDPNQWHIVS